MRDFSFVSELKKPWVSITHERDSQQGIPDGILLLELDAGLMKNLDGLYREFTSAFRFPDYFGKNFNALDECITDLDWLPADGYLLVIKNADRLLQDEPSETLSSLLSILDCAGSEWATPVEEGVAWDREGVPFHTILELDKDKVSDFQSKLKMLNFMINSLE